MIHVLPRGRGIAEIRAFEKGRLDSTYYDWAATLEWDDEDWSTAEVRLAMAAPSLPIRRELARVFVAMGLRRVYYHRADGRKVDFLRGDRPDRLDRAKRR